MNLVGFTKYNHASYREYLPYNEQLSSSVHKRAIFFSMFNAYVEKDLQFSKSEMKHTSSIGQSFRARIISEIDISCIRPFVVNVKSGIRIDMASTLLIHAYFLGTKIAFPMKKKPILRIGKLISLIYSPSGLSLMLDLEDMFLHLVYERIKKVNKNAEVLLHENSIVIKDSREWVPNSLIIPSYRKIEKDKLYNDENFIRQMDKVAKSISTGEFTQVFLVYPKHPNFKKYINLKLANHSRKIPEAYTIRMMPYSFSFCAKETRCINTKRPRSS